MTLGNKKEETSRASQLPAPGVGLITAAAFVSTIDGTCDASRTRTRQRLTLGWFSYFSGVRPSKTAARSPEQGHRGETLAARASRLGHSLLEPAKNPRRCATGRSISSSAVGTKSGAVALARKLAGSCLRCCVTRTGYLRADQGVGNLRASGSRRNGRR